MKHAPFSLIFFCSVMAWVGWIVLATDPNIRISHGCSPVGWVGNITVSLTAFVYPKGEGGVQHFFDRSEYACRYAVWRVVYEKQWKAAHPGQPLPGSPEDLERQHAAEEAAADKAEAAAEKKKQAQQGQGSSSGSEQAAGHDPEGGQQ